MNKIVYCRIVSCSMEQQQLPPAHLVHLMRLHFAACSIPTVISLRTFSEYLYVPSSILTSQGQRVGLVAKTRDPRIARY